MHAKWYPVCCSADTHPVFVFVLFCEYSFFITFFRADFRAHGCARRAVVLHARSDGGLQGDAYDMGVRLSMWLYQVHLLLSIFSPSLYNL